MINIVSRLLYIYLYNCMGLSVHGLRRRDPEAVIRLIPLAEFVLFSEYVTMLNLNLMKTTTGRNVVLVTNKPSSEFHYRILFTYSVHVSSSLFLVFLVFLDSFVLLD